ncbi:hypothetical protein VKT23_008158 [Stygiomarasmius scandens]|uniref:Uncharacterized protein n=1 Tax=Marasmiellus scandens TaxID=2682957 RepID=A0ABR1JHG2_9AGAR
MTASSTVPFRCSTPTSPATKRPQNNPLFSTPCKRVKTLSQLPSEIDYVPSSQSPEEWPDIKKEVLSQILNENLSVPQVNPAAAVRSPSQISETQTDYDFQFASHVNPAAAVRSPSQISETQTDYDFQFYNQQTLRCNGTEITDGFFDEQAVDLDMPVGTILPSSQTSAPKIADFNLSRSAFEIIYSSSEVKGLLGGMDLRGVLEEWKDPNTITETAHSASLVQC